MHEQELLDFILKQHLVYCYKILPLEEDVSVVYEHNLGYVVEAQNEIAVYFKTVI